MGVKTTKGIKKKTAATKKVVKKVSVKTAKRGTKNGTVAKVSPFGLKTVAVKGGHNWEIGKGKTALAVSPKAFATQGAAKAAGKRFLKVAPKLAQAAVQ